MHQSFEVKKESNQLTAVLGSIYLMVLFWILLLKLGVKFTYMDQRITNFIPFGDSMIFEAENILNTVVFIPLGIYAGMLFFQRGRGKIVFSLFLISLVVEGAQFVWKLGAFDVTDLITNTFGGIIGILIFKALGKAFNSPVQAQNFINKMAIIGTALMMILLILLKMNLLPIRYQ